MYKRQQYNIEAEEVKNKENILRNFFIKKIKKISADYSFSLEHFLRATVLGAVSYTHLS